MRDSSASTSPCRNWKTVWPICGGPSIWMSRELGVRIETSDGKQLSLVEVLDRLINSGVALHGRACISLAAVPLINLAVNLVLTRAR